MGYKISHLPLVKDIETTPVLKKLVLAHKALAELKGVAHTVPNQSVLVATLSLQEAKDSSAIENIITSQDELYKSDYSSKSFTSLEAKEVHNYAFALRQGSHEVEKRGLIRLNDILSVQKEIVQNTAGFRKLPGTELKNSRTGEIVYTPPQDPEEIIDLMKNLEVFINDDALSSLDPLTKMAVIHHQFESIHPFYDGNGRTGRVLSVLYLLKLGLLESPILYMSRYINQTKDVYYRLLQLVRETGAWEEWILYMLEAVYQTSHETVIMIKKIKDLMQTFKKEIREKAPQIYSQELLNNLFRHPYTKIEFVSAEAHIHRNTASKYLEALVEMGLLTKHKFGKENLYLNEKLFNLLIDKDR
jgi:Fic family protein